MEPSSLKADASVAGLLYVRDGVPGYDYNFLGLQRTSIASDKKLSAGKTEVAG